MRASSAIIITACAILSAAAQDNCDSTTGTCTSATPQAFDGQQLLQKNLGGLEPEKADATEQLEEKTAEEHTEEDPVMLKLNAQMDNMNSRIAKLKGTLPAKGEDELSKLQGMMAKLAEQKETLVAELRNAAAGEDDEEDEDEEGDEDEDEDDIFYMEDAADDHPALIQEGDDDDNDDDDDEEDDPPTVGEPIEDSNAALIQDGDDEQESDDDDDDDNDDDDDDDAEPAADEGEAVEEAVEELKDDVVDEPSASTLSDDE
eukprot:gnl/TRDRNA2_/TRDRNA2_35524_c0_seq1.p1 gnl/TRDRNA2_/TRDRNA2_35524_c0~~gnl/TRDRNA2_/TRDRNA2_35524_c0_seq1.p1  ORF type:complete len:260 (+),score=114.82 gnl/TRDRNA2_/TRDRNA2_35524_c0_seq1:74-853(+)